MGTEKLSKAVYVSKLLAFETWGMEYLNMSGLIDRPIHENVLIIVQY